MLICSALITFSDDKLSILAIVLSVILFRTTFALITPFPAPEPAINISWLSFTLFASISILLSIDKFEPPAIIASVVELSLV